MNRLFICLALFVIVDMILFEAHVAAFRKELQLSDAAYDGACTLYCQHRVCPSPLHLHRYGFDRVLPE
ncbi:hypothetical protein Y032_0643g1055 [Ancylostoma ceylanicum]|uniref:Uncharacterized protein n=1 Tax=Ancylostoma ceylanicum TaxID=53326 RepID=A0A016WJ88_9BILA|nr:hypothetical protein Y032_0643g1055 [Ancylostoma ceylanicum]